MDGTAPLAMEKPHPHLDQPAKPSSRSDSDILPAGALRRPTLNNDAHRKALRKLDLILLTTVTVIYFLNFLDRSNIGNARAAGLQTDLKLSNMQYSIALTVTYVPYIAAELPLTLLIKKIGPHILLPTLVISWGLVCLFQGFVTSYSGLLAARFFLGLTEGAILPGSITYLSMFYRRGEMGKRVAFFFSATSLAGAFSGLLAAAILNLDGRGGKRGWAWIFIIEGLVTVVIGAITFFILPADPARARFLSEAEKDSILTALEMDREYEEDVDELTWASCSSALRSPQMWFVFAQFFCSGVTLYSLAYFAPTIVQAIGYRGTSIQLHSVPPYVCSAFVAIVTCWSGDVLRHRGAFVVLAGCLSIVGYAMYLSSTNPQVLYASLFFQIMGAYSVAPLQSTWMPNNLAPFYKRATGISFGFIATNSGGILSTWLFPTTEAPRYTRATRILISLSSFMVVMAIVNSLYLARENKRRAKLIADKGYRREENEGEGTGDNNVWFKYIT